MEDNKVVDANYVEDAPHAIEYDIEKLAAENPELAQALNKLKADEELIQPDVDAILKMLKGKMEDKDSPFDLSHGFMVLSKCISYLATAVCKDYGHFQDEIKKAHLMVINNVMPSIPQDDIENFTLRRLILTSACLIDYLHWREILGDYVTDKGQAQQDVQAETESN